MHRQQYAEDRKKIFHWRRETRLVIHEWLKNPFANSASGASDAEFLGLDVEHSFEVHSAHFATRIGPEGNHCFQLVMHITQETAVDDGHGRDMRFEGGSMLIANLEAPVISYCIRKPIKSTTRLERQRRYRDEIAQGSLRATYLSGGDPAGVKEPLAMLHRGSF